MFTIDGASRKDSKILLTNNAAKKIATPNLCEPINGLTVFEFELACNILNTNELS